MEKIKELGRYHNFNQSKVVDIDGLAPTVTENHGQVTAILGNVVRERESHLKIKNATKKGYLNASDGDGVDLEKRKGRRGTVQKGVSLTLKTQDDVGVVVKDKNEELPYCPKDYNCYECEEYEHCSFRMRNDYLYDIWCEEQLEILRKQDEELKKDKPICINRKVNGKQPSVQDRAYSSSSTAVTTGYMPSLTDKDNLRIRKLTERECLRLMGVKDRDSNKMTVSKSQKYKQAGNSIVVQVLMGIFGELLGVDYQTKIKESIKDIKNE